MQNIRGRAVDQLNRMTNKMCDIICDNNSEEFIKVLRGLSHPNEVCTNIGAGGETPIHLAIRRNRMPILANILKLDVNVNCRNNKGFSPLHYALIYGHLKWADMLISKGAQISDVSRKNGKTLMHKLIFNYDAVQFLLKKGSPPDQCDEHGRSCLHHAVPMGNVAIVQLLLDHGASANLLDKFSQSPLHLCIMFNYPEISKVLINHGANVNLYDETGRTLLQCAILASNVEITKQILSRSILTMDSKEKLLGQTPLHYACQVNCYPIVKLLISYGAEVNFSNMCNETPLHIASLVGEAKIVKLIIDNMVRIDRKKTTPSKKRGETPADHGQRRVDALLAANAGRVDKKTIIGKTALMIAIEHGHRKIVDILLAAKANVNARDILGFTPLHYAVEKKQSCFLGLLVEHGADVNAADNEQKTPLHHAIIARNDVIGDDLISLGADVDIVDDTQLKPMDYKKLRVLNFQIKPRNKFQELFQKFKESRK